MDNDRVRVEVVQGRDGRPAGRLVDVLDRRRQLVIGTYHARRGRAWVEPREESLEVISVPPTQLARDGDLVKVRLGVGSAVLSPGEPLTGEVAGSLGKSEDASVEVLSLAYAQGFHDEFPAPVMDESDAVPATVSEDEALAEGRVDLRNLPLVTIDGEDARDFDDAIYVEEEADRFRLVVAIADVSHYVKEGTAVDDEALRRATSVYLPGRVLPMLPERLSNGICSLRPNEDRLCMVADMEIGLEGAPGKSRIYPAVMRSAARLTYTEVQKVLSGGGLGRPAIETMLHRAGRLARVLTKMRERRGAIDFDLPETRIELDDDGMPLRMVRREREESHRLVEECMLAANEAVARFFQERRLPSVYRYHGEPDEEKLAIFATLARTYGFELPLKKISSVDLNGLLEKLEGHPERRALNQLLLRSMMQAVYTAEQVGHYGLAAEHYLHFTSPIRRYPDLLVHRLLRAEWARDRRPRSKRAVDAERTQLEELAQRCSERERAAMQVERDVVSFYAALLMKDRVGEEFPGVVSALTDFGFFVELEELFIEGLVKGENVEPNFHLDARSHSLVFGSGRRVRVGQKVQVRLEAVQLRRRQLDFALVEEGLGAGRTRLGGRRGGHESPERERSRPHRSRSSEAAHRDEVRPPVPVAVEPAEPPALNKPPARRIHPTRAEILSGRAMRGPKSKAGGPGGRGAAPSHRGGGKGGKGGRGRK